MHGGGHEVCSVTAMKDANRRPAGTRSVRVGNPRNHSAPSPSFDDLERSEGLGCVSQLAWLDRLHGVRDMPVCDSGMLPDSDRRCWPESTEVGIRGE